MQTPIKTVRIATVKATGARYIVQQLQFGEPAKAFCWGEVISFNGKSAKHADSKVFLLGAVDVKEVERTSDLMRELNDQYIAGLRAAGHVVTVNRKSYCDHGTPEQIEARNEANAAFRGLLQAAENGVLTNFLLYGETR